MRTAYAINAFYVFVTAHLSTVQLHILPYLIVIRRATLLLGAVIVTMEGAIQCYTAGMRSTQGETTSVR